MKVGILLVLINLETAGNISNERRDSVLHKNPSDRFTVLIPLFFSAMKYLYLQYVRVLRVSASIDGYKPSALNYKKTAVDIIWQK